MEGGTNWYLKKGQDLDLEKHFAMARKKHVLVKALYKYLCKLIRYMFIPVFSLFVIPKEFVNDGSK